MSPALPLLLLLAGCQHTLKPQVSSATVPVVLGSHTLQAELAATPTDRGRGLMFRRELEGGQGMLFVWPMEDIHCMWMKNTYLPLSVAFMDRNGTIVNIEDMAPFDETTSHCSASPVPYALEVPLGWFVEQGIMPGDAAHFGLPTDLQPW